MDSKVFKQINSLKAELRSANAKSENLTFLLGQAREEVKVLEREKEKYRRGGGVGGAPDAATSRKLLKLRQENHLLHSEMQRLEEEKQQLVEEVKSMDKKLDEADDVLREEAKKSENLSKNCEMAKSLASKYEREARDLKVELKQIEAREAQLKKTLDAKADMLGHLEIEAKLLGKHKAEMENARRTTNRLRKQLALVTEDTNADLHDAQNAIHAKEILLDQFKLGYDDHIETSKLEWESERDALASRLSSIKIEYEDYKTMQHEDKQQSIREQTSIIKTMQKHFNDYRETAEYLFATEAKTLQDRLQAQMTQYEQEIQYIIQTKDMHFDEMMKAKDAKIMNLIEGTDFQQLLVKHELDIEQLKRAHADDIDKVRIATEAQMRSAMSDLEENIAKGAAGREKLKKTIANLERDLQNAFDTNAEKDGQMLSKEKEHQEVIRRVQLRLEQSYRDMDQLKREKAMLRHSIVRLKIQTSGNGDETLPNLVTRLSMEAESLQKKSSEMETKYSDALETITKLETKVSVQAKKIKETLLKNSARENEFQDLLATFQRYLAKRANMLRGVADEKLVKKRSSSGDISLSNALGVLQNLINKEFDLGGKEDADERVEDEIRGSLDKDDGASASVRAKIPKKLQRLKMEATGGHGLVDSGEVVEIARGMRYLKRFDKLSKAFEGGSLNLKKVHAGASSSANKGGLNYPAEDLAGMGGELWDGAALYRSMEAAEEQRKKQAQLVYGTKFQSSFIKDYGAERSGPSALGYKEYGERNVMPSPPQKKAAAGAYNFSRQASLTDPTDTRKTKRRNQSPRTPVY